MARASYGSTPAFRRVAWPAAAAAARTGTLVLALALLAAHEARWATRADKGLLDWGSFVASGRAANRGDDPFGVYDLTFRVGPTEAPAPNLNPPISVYPFRVVAPFDPARSMSMVEAGSVALFAACVLALRRAYPHAGWPAVAWAFAFAGLWHTVELGQIYVPLMAAATIAWLLLRRGDSAWAGVAMGLVAAFKPQFILWPVFLALAGRPRAGGSGIATAAALSALPFVLGGPELYREWLAATPPLLPPMTFPGNSSLLAVTGRFDAGLAGLALTAVVIGAAGAWAWRTRPAPERVGLVAIGVALLAGPITWPGYTLLLVPALFAFGPRRAWPGLMLLVVPYQFVVTYADGLPVLGSIYTAGIVLFVAGALAPRTWHARPRFARRESAEATPA